MRRSMPSSTRMPPRTLPCCCRVRALLTHRRWWPTALGLLRKPTRNATSPRSPARQGETRGARSARMSVVLGKPHCDPRRLRYVARVAAIASVKRALKAAKADVLAARAGDLPKAYPMAATNKCLARSNKSRTGHKATKKRNRQRMPITTLGTTLQSCSFRVLR